MGSKDLTYHPSFADSTFSRVHLSSSLPEWSDVELIIQTGKSMDINLYTVEVYQRGGPASMLHRRWQRRQMCRRRGQGTFFDTTTRRCISRSRTRESPLLYSLAITSMPLSLGLSASSVGPSSQILH